jgi:hypothetical protein
MGLATTDATAQAALVRSGQASPLELVDAAIDRIERINPSLNAVIHEHYDTARAEARDGYPCRFSSKTSSARPRAIRTTAASNSWAPDPTRCVTRSSRRASRAGRAMDGAPATSPRLIAVTAPDRR